MKPRRNGSAACAGQGSAGDEARRSFGAGCTEAATITARKVGKAIPNGLLTDTPEEHKRRGDAADAMFREFKRLIAAAKP